MSNIEVSKPTDFTNYGDSVDADRAYDQAICVGGDETTYVIINIDRNEEPSIDWHTWGTKWVETYDSTSLKFKWRAVSTGGDDEWKAEYTKNGVDWLEFKAFGAYRSETWVTESIAVDANQDLSLLGFRISTDTIKGGDGHNLYISDIWTEGVWTEPYTWVKKKDLSDETPSQTRIRAIERIAEGVVLLGTAPDGQVWKSTDTGETWVLKKDLSDETPAQTIIYSIAHMSGDIALLSTWNRCQIWKSTDAGDNWTLKKSIYDETPSQVLGLTLERITDSIALCGTAYDAQIWETDDTGETWTLAQTLMDGGSFGEVAQITRMSDTIVLAAVNVDDVGQIWKSTDAGSSWTKKKDFSGVLSMVSSICRISSTVALAATGAGPEIWKSTDTGDTWTKKFDFGDHCPTKATATHVVFMNGTICLAFVQGSTAYPTIWRSTDSGDTWYLISLLEGMSPEQTQFTCACSPYDDYTIFAATYPDGQVWKSIIGVPPTYDVALNIGDSFKEGTELKINIGDAWKVVTEVKINVGDAWKAIVVP